MSSLASHQKLLGKDAGFFVVLLINYAFLMKPKTYNCGVSQLTWLVRRMTYLTNDLL